MQVAVQCSLPNMPPARWLGHATDHATRLFATMFPGASSAASAGLFRKDPSLGTLYKPGAPRPTEVGWDKQKGTRVQHTGPVVVWSKPSPKDCAWSGQLLAREIVTGCFHAHGLELRG